MGAGGEGGGWNTDGGQAVTDQCIQILKVSEAGGIFRTGTEGRKGVN